MSLHGSAEAVWQAVVPQLPGFSVEVVPSVDSTNSALMRRARAGQLDPVLLVAERQTAGRGRLGRDWQSEADPAPEPTPAPFRAAIPPHPSSPSGPAALTFSLGLPLQASDWSGLSLAVGLAVVQALHPALQLKWPNDVWLHDRKLAGILIETTQVQGQRYLVVGVGINLHPRAGVGLRTAPAALLEVLPQATAGSTLEAVAPAVVQAVLAFEGAGFAGLREAFHARDRLYGCVVDCTDGTHGIARGVDASGALLVHTAGGIQAISSAEVSVRPAAPADPLP